LQGRHRPAETEHVPMTTPLRLTIVCENTVGSPLPLLGEHGFACLIDSPAGRILFDSGRGAGLLHNLAVLGIDPTSIEAIVLSHGHYDHAGGLLPLLQRIGPRPVIAHPGIFAERYSLREGEQRRLSLEVSRQELEAAGARFQFCDDCCEVMPQLWFSGRIPRTQSVETGDPNLVVARGGGGGWLPDPFDDDAALALLTPHGLVIVLGCAHAGLINTVEHFRTRLATPTVYAIVGGTHLGPASEAQFAAATDYLAGLGGARIGVAHCTGQPRAARLYSRFPERVFFAAAGCEFTVAPGT
jgi:7,8-dihydropterin-6-yl-methyl-4-(beta-D-ribofuranosyl)aminobenzene 5'-phosphate synthase